MFDHDKFGNTGDFEFRGQEPRSGEDDLGPTEDMFTGLTDEELLSIIDKNPNFIATEKYNKILFMLKASGWYEISEKEAFKNNGIIPMGSPLREKRRLMDKGTIRILYYTVNEFSKKSDPETGQKMIIKKARLFLYGKNEGYPQMFRGIGNPKAVKNKPKRKRRKNKKPLDK